MRDKIKISHPLVELTKMRLLEFARSPGAIFWVFVFPVLLAVALGIAFRNQPPASPKLAVVGPERDAVTSHIKGNGEIDILPLGESEANEALRTGRIDIVVRAEPSDGATPRFVYRYDPTRPESRQARLVVDNALQRTFGRVDPARV
jgi:ABC-2 type transport system permease protein